MRKFITIFVILFINSILINAQCDKDCSKSCDKKRVSTTAQASTNKSSDEEFLPYNSNENQNAKSNSEDEFIEYNSKTDSIANAPKQAIVQEAKWYEHKLFYPILSLLATILAGIFVRFRPTRKLRGIFLVTSAVTLGFYIGACPCPISSFSYTIIALTGGEIIWENMIWFLALIPITYLFHKTWCGWICHLGALQEFLFIPSAKIKLFDSERSQKVMKIIRYILVATLIIQVAITHSYLYDKIDPFKTAYNLGYNASYTEWILLGLLLLSSIFIYRPFCKTACPIGLILGWIAKIKGARVLGAAPECISCTVGAQSCNINAITRKNGYSELDNKECQACGECISACKRSAIKFYSKGKEHPDLVKMCKKD